MNLWHGTVAKLAIVTVREGVETSVRVSTVRNGRVCESGRRINGVYGVQVQKPTLEVRIGGPFDERMRRNIVGAEVR
jgi:hypothetical protein